MSPGFVVSVLATLTTGLITLWLLYEDWAVFHSDKSGKPKLRLEDRKAANLYAMAQIRRLAAGDNTITAWTRFYENVISQHGKTHWLVIFGVILGLLIGHLAWH